MLSVILCLVTVVGSQSIDYIACLRRPPQPGDVFIARGMLMPSGSLWSCNLEKSLLTNVFTHVVSRNYLGHTVYSARPGCCETTWQPEDRIQGVPFGMGQKFSIVIRVLDDSSYSVEYPGSAFPGHTFRQRGGAALFTPLSGVRVFRCSGAISSIQFSGAAENAAKFNHLSNCPLVLPRPRCTLPRCGNDNREHQHSHEYSGEYDKNWDHDYNGNDRTRNEHKNKNKPNSGEYGDGNNSANGNHNSEDDQNSNINVNIDLQQLVQL